LVSVWRFSFFGPCFLILSRHSPIAPLSGSFRIHLSFPNQPRISLKSLLMLVFFPILDVLCPPGMCGYAFQKDKKPCLNGKVDFLFSPVLTPATFFRSPFLVQGHFLGAGGFEPFFESLFTSPANTSNRRVRQPPEQTRDLP